MTQYKSVEAVKQEIIEGLHYAGPNNSNLGCCYSDYCSSEHDKAIDEYLSTALDRMAEVAEKRGMEKSQEIIDEMMQEAREEALRELSDAAEMLWVVLANVSGGDWTQQTPEWQEAAAKWRDNYFSTIAKSNPNHHE